ncbi:hypothetical protein E4U22_006324, partial [Claviceps purpurea]
MDVLQLQILMSIVDVVVGQLLKPERRMWDRVARTSSWLPYKLICTFLHPAD